MTNLHLPERLPKLIKWIWSNAAYAFLSAIVFAIHGILPSLSVGQISRLYFLSMIILIFLLGLSIHLYGKLNQKERELKQSVEDFSFVNKRLHDFYPAFDMEHEREFNKGWDSAQ
jgi:hypothetical protein